MKSMNILDSSLIKSAYFFIIVLGILNTTSNLTTSTTLLMIEVVLALITTTSAIVSSFNKGAISKKIFCFYCLIFISLILSLIFKSYSISLLYLLGISAFNFSPKELVKIYFYSTLVGFCVSFLLGVFGVISFSNLGFNNKNMLGFYLLSEVIFYFYLKPGSKKIIQFLTFLIVFFLEFFVIKDRTAGILSIVYLILVLLKRNDKKLKGKAIIALPFILTIISIFLGENFSLNSNWINIVNKALSNRLLFWNFNLNQYGIKFFPQRIESFNVLLNDGSFTVNYLDNGYLNFLIGIGYLQTIILLVIICIAIRNVIIRDRYNELIIIVVLLLYAFTEKVIFSPICCILFPLCFLEIKSGYVVSREIK